MIHEKKKNDRNDLRVQEVRTRALLYSNTSYSQLQKFNIRGSEREQKTGISSAILRQLKKNAGLTPGSAGFPRYCGDDTLPFGAIPILVSHTNCFYRSFVLVYVKQKKKRSVQALPRANRSCNVQKLTKYVAMQSCPVQKTVLPCRRRASIPYQGVIYHVYVGGGYALMLIPVA